MFLNLKAVISGRGKINSSALEAQEQKTSSPLEDMLLRIKANYNKDINTKHLIETTIQSIKKNRLKKTDIRTLEIFFRNIPLQPKKAHLEKLKNYLEKIHQVSHLTEKNLQKLNQQQDNVASLFPASASLSAPATPRQLTPRSPNEKAEARKLEELKDLIGEEGKIVTPAKLKGREHYAARQEKGIFITTWK